ncbi:hypothetical protein BD408DRAFT_437259 [Parasitella parasitica]|nr:hypothetical protein BD408DRAFT_437259 [Parasitella parasitica]
MCLFFTLLAFSAIYLVCVLAQPIISPSPAFSYRNINTIVSFGDSYTTRYLDVDSLTYACRNCTSAGGPNWVIYLTDSTQWISWDFAYNSAPVNNSIVNQVPTVIDVSTQVRELYQQILVSPTEKIATIVDSVYAKRGIQHTHESTLVTIWVGINDIDLTYNWNQTDDLDLLIMRRYELLINELIEKGERNFMLINVPPIHRAPMWRGTENEKIIETRVADYNKKLKNTMKHLKQFYASAATAITFIEYDAWRFFDHLLDNSGSYGMTDTLTFCPDWSHPIENHCKPIGEYFWLNDLHPTFHVHDLLSQDVKRVLQLYA